MLDAWCMQSVSLTAWYTTMGRAEIWQIRCHKKSRRRIALRASKIHVSIWSFFLSWGIVLYTLIYFLMSKIEHLSLKNIVIKIIFFSSVFILSEDVRESELPWWCGCFLWIHLFNLSLFISVGWLEAGYLAAMWPRRWEPQSWTGWFRYLVLMLK